MKKTVYAYVHTHWDREWYRDFEEFRVRLVEVFDDVLEKLSRKELKAFYFDGQTSALQDYLEIKPQNENLVKRFIKEKKLFIGPYFCSTDSFLVDSESLIKNLQLGLDYSQKFGCKDFIAYHADTFGHSAYIPQIIKYFDINKAVFWRGLGELPSEFKFNGLDSVYLIEGYFHDYFSANISLEKKAEFLKRTLDRISSYSGNNILLPLGADHLCIPYDLKKQIEQVNELLDDYKIVLATPFDYFEKVSDRFVQDFQGEFRDSCRNFILPGILSSRTDLKQFNSALQWRIARLMQPLATLSGLFLPQKDYQNEINYAYQLLLRNHAHDSIYGCSIDSVHKENIARYNKVNSVLNAIENTIKCKFKSFDNLGVLNFSNYMFSGNVRFVTDKNLQENSSIQLISKTQGFPIEKVYPVNQIPITEDYTTLYEYLINVANVSPFSFKSFGDLSVYDTSSCSDLRITESTIENDFIKLMLKNKKLVLIDKKRDKMYSDFINFIDRVDIGDSYNFGALKNDKPLKAVPVSTKMLENGPLRCVLNVRFEISIPATSTDKGRSKSLKKHLLDLKILLEKHSEYIEFNLDWVNKSKNHILQLELKLDDYVNETLSDDLIGAVKRVFDADYDISRFVPAKRGIELKQNVAPLQKYVIVQNVALMTKGLQEYEVFQDKLRLTLLRSTGLISNPHNPTRGTPAGPPLPTPDLQMLGNNTANFAIAFEKEPLKVNSLTEKFYGIVSVLDFPCNEFTLFKNNNENIVLSTIKKNETSGMLLRFVNNSSEKQLFSFSTQLKCKKIYITDALEKPLRVYKPFIMEPKSFVTVLLDGVEKFFI